MKILAKKGFLSSQRGVHGGYGLTRNSREISLAEIIEALEGPIAITDCHSEESTCEQEPRCPVRGHWKLINDAISEALENIDLETMVGTHEPQETYLPMNPSET